MKRFPFQKKHERVLVPWDVVASEGSEKILSVGLKDLKLNSQWKSERTPFCRCKTYTS